MISDNEVKFDVEHRVIEIVAKQLKKDPAEINKTSHLVNDLGLDSLDLIELVMAVEESFGIEATDDEVAKLSTISDIVSYIEKLKKHPQH